MVYGTAEGGVNPPGKSRLVIYILMSFLLLSSDLLSIIARALNNDQNGLNYQTEKKKKTESWGQEKEGIQVNIFLEHVFVQLL